MLWQYLLGPFVALYVEEVSQHSSGAILVTLAIVRGPRLLARVQTAIFAFALEDD